MLDVQGLKPIRAWARGIGSARGTVLLMEARLRGWGVRVRAQGLRSLVARVWGIGCARVREGAACLGRVQGGELLPEAATVLLKEFREEGAVEGLLMQIGGLQAHLREHGAHEGRDCDPNVVRRFAGVNLEGEGRGREKGQGRPGEPR